MEEEGTAPSQASGCSSVLCTYNLSDIVLQQEPSPGLLEEDLSFDLNSASWLPKNTGSITNDCEEDDSLRLENTGRSLEVPHYREALTVTDQTCCTFTSPHQQERKLSVSEAQIRTSLDAFYEGSCQTGDDPHQLSEKILDLRKKRHLYALRCFQLAKIVLNQEGTNILQDCPSNNVFTAPEETKKAINMKNVPGLSKDVVGFIMDKKKT